MLCEAALDSSILFVTGTVRQRGNPRTPQEAINYGLELWRRSRTGTTRNNLKILFSKYAWSHVDRVTS